LIIYKMVPSPPKRASHTTTFDTTWNESDAASFDPNALRVGKIPRGWERKQEVKKSGEGKEKKIWRRFNLRSRADTTTQEEEEDEEEYDARSRAVKRRQHMSPKAMEKTTGKLNGKKRAFKATRWDRRKSVLPSRTFTACEFGPR
jgi:flagellar biosynthesis GTPase FlhF